MQVVIFLVLLIHVSYSKRVAVELYNIWEDIILPYGEKCAGLANVTSQYVREKILSADIPNEQNFKEYLKCIYENLDFIQTNGEINIEVINQVPYMTEELVNECISAARIEHAVLDKSYLLCTCVVHAFAH